MTVRLLSRAGAGNGLRCGIFLTAALLGSVIPPAYGAESTSSTRQEQADKTDARRDALKELSFIDAITLEEIRETCAEGRAYQVRQKQLARGNGFPEVHEWCRAAVDAAAARELPLHLFGSLAVRQLGVGRMVHSDATVAAIQNGEPAKVGSAVLSASSKGMTTYIGLSAKAEPLRPELAYEAGHWYGSIKPEAVPLLSPEILEQAARACFTETPAVTISLNGAAMPATKACLILGGNAGKKFATRR